MRRVSLVVDFRDLKRNVALASTRSAFSTARFLRLASCGGARLKPKGPQAIAGPDKNSETLQTPRLRGERLGELQW